MFQAAKGKGKEGGGKKRASRQVAQAPANDLAPEALARRTKRHLEELERSNYAEPKLSFIDDEEEGTSTKKPDRSRATLSDTKRKSTAAIRRVLLYRKNLATLIEESGIADLPPEVPTYLTAAAPPSIVPPRAFCSVCGYWGHYRCQKCGLSYCDRSCEATHNETRCERRII
ncbi:hypothetical protein BOTBODRAFT_274832 [Botryobasidium botryosum FD-172 SS1]|uniref:HIT-type domain-containing protein n=1 Tax=Botryobasidium botryosum (strain FD-172 SS1) TaxID=930990 RepID=A0A067MVK8_BOTB1|nr:hypothetical protein BOTBODRAFT_274832 [Botryobasidium botryosum FD-172 SS1]